MRDGVANGREQTSGLYVCMHACERVYNIRERGFGLIVTTITTPASIAHIHTQTYRHINEHTQLHTYTGARARAYTHRTCTQTLIW